MGLFDPHVGAALRWNKQRERERLVRDARQTLAASHDEAWYQRIAADRETRVAAERERWLDDLHAGRLSYSD